jgi:rubredoxin
MSDYKRYQCSICGHIYDEAEGDLDTGIMPGTLWENIPDDWRCPECGAEKSAYDLMPNQ